MLTRVAAINRGSESIQLVIHTPLPYKEAGFCSVMLSSLSVSAYGRRMLTLPLTAYSLKVPGLWTRSILRWWQPCSH